MRLHQYTIYHPVGGLRGLGDFVRGQFAVPQNPVMDGNRGMSGLADFVHAEFTVPQNPITDYYGMSGLSGCGCGCGGGCGMGSISSDFSAMTSGTAPMTTYLLYGGGALAAAWLLFGMGGGRHRR